MDATTRRAALKGRARPILDITRAAHGVADVHRSAMMATDASKAPAANLRDLAAQLNAIADRLAGGAS